MANNSPHSDAELRRLMTGSSLTKGVAQGWRQLDPTLPPSQPQTWVEDSTGARIDNAVPDSNFGGLRTHYTDAQKTAAGGHDLITDSSGTIGTIDRGKALAKAAAAVGGIVTGGLALGGGLGGGASAGATGGGSGTASAGMPSWLKAATMLGGVATSAARGAAEGRIAQNQANVQQDTLAIARARLAAELNAQRIADTNHLNRQVVAGDIQHNIQPFHLSVPGVKDSTSTGGYNVSALGPNSREAGATMSQNALADLVSGKSAGELKPPPATPQPQASWVSKALGVLGPALSVGGMFAGGAPKAPGSGFADVAPAVADPNDPYGLMKPKPKVVT